MIIEKELVYNIYPHQIRNSLDKRFFMSAGVIYTLSILLGHSSVSITERAYLDLAGKDFLL